MSLGSTRARDGCNFVWLMPTAVGRAQLPTVFRITDRANCRCDANAKIESVRFNCRVVRAQNSFTQNQELTGSRHWASQLVDTPGESSLAATSMAAASDSTCAAVGDVSDVSAVCAFNDASDVSEAVVSASYLCSDGDENDGCTAAMLSRLSV